MTDNGNSSSEHTEKETPSVTKMTAKKEAQAAPKTTIQTLFLSSIISVVISLIIATGAVYLYDQQYAQKVVAIDLKGFLKQQKDDYLAGKITEEDVDRRMDELEAFVDHIPKHHPVILGDVVVRNIEVLKP